MLYEYSKERASSPLSPVLLKDPTRRRRAFSQTASLSVQLSLPDSPNIHDPHLLHDVIRYRVITLSDFVVALLREILLRESSFTI